MVWLLLVVTAFGGKNDEPTEVDPLALASMLVRDQHFDRAEKVLDGIEPATVDAAQLYTLRGLVAFHTESWTAAADAFAAAIEAGEADALIRVYLGQSLLSDSRPAEAAAALDHPSVEALAAAWLIRARALWDADDTDVAWAVLEEGGRRFPEREEFGLQRTLLLIDLGLYQEARRQGVTILAESGTDPKTWALVGDALRRAGHADEATVLLEEARLRFAGELDILVPLAHAWLAEDKPLAAGAVMQEAAVLDGTYASESAELFRRAGRYDRAMAMNALVPDSEAKAQQRLGLLLEMRQNDKALALMPRLERLGLTERDDIAYSLAYAAFQAGDLDIAEDWLTGIDDPQIFADATLLREAMARCADSAGCP